MISLPIAATALASAARLLSFAERTAAPPGAAVVDAEGATELEADDDPEADAEPEADPETVPDAAVVEGEAVEEVVLDAGAVVVEEVKTWICAWAVVVVVGVGEGEGVVLGGV